MFEGSRVLILVAHPDDETLGCGGHIAHWPDCLIVHTTDGSPRNLADANAAGFATREDYARARRHELECALAYAGAKPTHCFGLTDQESWRDLADLTEQVKRIIDDACPDVVITHPYEGGHPDHDACAFAVQGSCTSLGEQAPARVEAAFYNRYEGVFRPHHFLPGPAVTDVLLDRDERRRKEAMLACFQTQRPVLSAFRTDIERFRIAPHYSFQAPPHASPLNYETWGWGITSSMWLEAAARAQSELAL